MAFFGCGDIQPNEIYNRHFGDKSPDMTTLVGAASKVNGAAQLRGCSPDGGSPQAIAALPYRVNGHQITS